MTKPYESMTDEELNAAAAEFAGLKIVRGKTRSGPYEYIENGPVLDPIPNYCQSIEAAMGLVEKMKESNIRIQIIPVYDGKHKYHVIPVKFDPNEFTVWKSLGDGIVKESLPRAITIVFVRLWRITNLFKSNQIVKVTCSGCKEKTKFPAVWGLTVFTAYVCKCGTKTDLYEGKLPTLKINGKKVKPTTKIIYEVNSNECREDD